MNFFDKFIAEHPIQRIENGEYITGGKGEIAFLVFPGGGQDALSCYDLIHEFEKDYKIIAISYTGFYCLNSLFDFVNKILEKERVERVILYGLSIGGFLAQHYARRYPNKTSLLVLSHTATTKSKTIVKRVSRPGKILYKLIPFVPQKILNRMFVPIAGRVQSGKSNFMQLYQKYSSGENLKRRSEFAQRSSFSMIDKDYLKTIYSLGIEMERLERNISPQDLYAWQGRTLILRTNNDPLAQDDGWFKKLYPKATVISFNDTGHLTPFIRFEEMVKTIREFIS